LAERQSKINFKYLSSHTGSYKSSQIKKGKENNMKNNKKKIISFIAGILIAITAIIFSIIQKEATTTNFSNNNNMGNRKNSSSVLDWIKRQDNTQYAMCSFKSPSSQCFNTTKLLCEADLKAARIAWKYFENNYQSKTGLVNSVNNYTSTTMWDTGSALAATIAANDFGFIDQKDFDDRITALLKTLNKFKLFNNEAPNKVYNTVTGEMVDYTNKPSPDGIGVSTLDLARLISWLDTLTCKYPKYTYQVNQTLSKWDYTRLIQKQQMFGLAKDPVTKKIQVLQEGRLGYEQYAGKIFADLGFDQSISSDYKNKFRRNINIYKTPIAYDSRDPRELGAYNYVVTESYGLDVMENGYDEKNRDLVQNIYNVQKERWKKTGAVTAVSEDNVDRAPWFIYNTIFTAGLPWNTTTDTGVTHNELKSISIKAAFSLATLFPNDPYSNELMSQIESAYDPEQGWFSGVYENGDGYNKAITANTNGIILSGLLYKKYGAFHPLCKKCQRGIKLKDEIFENINTNLCATVKPKKSL